MSTPYVKSQDIEFQRNSFWMFLDVFGCSDMIRYASQWAGLKNLAVRSPTCPPLCQGSEWKMMYLYSTSWLKTSHFLGVSKPSWTLNLKGNGWRLWNPSIHLLCSCGRANMSFSRNCRLLPSMVVMKHPYSNSLLDPFDSFCWLLVSSKHTPSISFHSRSLAFQTNPNPEWVIFSYQFDCGTMLNSNKHNSVPELDGDKLAQV